jgi:DNA-binding PadR family transcriptional regulator
MGNFSGEQAMLATLTDPLLEKQIAKDLKERTIVAFLDVIIMRQLKVQMQSGYDIIQHVHSKYSVLVSPGTVYAQLYSMEKKGFIRAHSEGGKKRSYQLTHLGVKILDIADTSKELGNFLFAFITEE